MEVRHTNQVNFLSLGDQFKPSTFPVPDRNGWCFLRLSMSSVMKTDASSFQLKLCPAAFTSRGIETRLLWRPVSSRCCFHCTGSTDISFSVFSVRAANHPTVEWEWADDGFLLCKLFCFVLEMFGFRHYFEDSHFFSFQIFSLALGRSQLSKLPSLWLQKGLQTLFTFLWTVWKCCWIGRPLTSREVGLSSELLSMVKFGQNSDLFCRGINLRTSPFISVITLVVEVRG